MKTSHEANNCARAITALVEQALGKEVPFEVCLKITACVQVAVDTETAKLTNDALTWQYWRDRARAAELKPEDAMTRDNVQNALAYRKGL